MKINKKVLKQESVKLKYDYLKEERKIYNSNIVDNESVLKLIFNYWFKKGNYLPLYCIYPLLKKYLNQERTMDLLYYCGYFERVEDLEHFYIGSFNTKLSINPPTEEEFKDFLFKKKNENLLIEDKNRIFSFYCNLNKTDKILCYWFYSKSNNINIFINAMNTVNSYSGFSQVVIKQLLGIKWSNNLSRPWVWQDVYCFYEFLSNNPDELLAIASATIIYNNLRFVINKDTYMDEYVRLVQEHNKNPTMISVIRVTPQLINRWHNIGLFYEEEKKMKFLMRYVELHS